MVVLTHQKRTVDPALHPLPCAMSKSDTWPGGIAMESLSNMDSAGSCDSVISMTSGYSEDSMEHLSAEERACLMYLEETIESLEVNEDSGLSTDEPESVLEAERISPMEVNDISNFKSGLRRRQKSDKAKHVPVNESSEPQSVLVSALIPPPSDFMDDPGPPPQPEKANRPSSPVTQEPLNNPPEPSTLTIGSSPHMRPPPDTIEPRSPPAVAPKPKKLPPNIILKSHKAAVADGNLTVHSVPTCSDRQMLDAQKVHTEALRKLGLLKADEADSGPALSPRTSTQTRRSWAAPSPPISPAAPHIPATTPSYTDLLSPLPASSPLQSPAAGSPPELFTAPTVQSLGVLPAPAAFNDTDTPLSPDTELSAANDVSGATVNTPTTTSVLVKELTSPKVKGVKSATMECSGVGPSSSVPGQNSTEDSQLRSNRPRPASLGSGTEISINRGEGAGGKELDIPRFLPTPEHFGESQKLPRSQGISVLICPRAENVDDRREALKRLGLLRD